MKIIACVNQRLPVKILFVVFLGAGAVITVSGSRLFGALSAMDYWYVNNHPLKLTTGIVAMTSTAYVVLMTRIVSIWSGMHERPIPKIENTQIQYIEKEKDKSCGERGFANAVAILGIINGLVPIASYLATRTVLHELGINNDIAIYSVTGYTALSNFVAYGGFTVKKAYKNAFYLSDGILSLKKHCDGGLIFKLAKTFGISILGASSYFIMQYFLAKNSLLKIPITANLSPLAANITSFSLCGLASSIYCFNQPIQVFRFFSDTEDEQKLNFYRYKILQSLQVTASGATAFGAMPMLPFAFPVTAPASIPLLLFAFSVIALSAIPMLSVITTAFGANPIIGDLNPPRAKNLLIPEVISLVFSLIIGTNVCSKKLMTLS